MEERTINSNWTIREDRIPRKNDVVSDPESVMGIVVATDGNISDKHLWIENEYGEEIYARVDAKNFRVENTFNTRDFYIKYKEKKGWEKGKIYTLKQKDYPLLLMDMEYDLVKQEVVYVFKDLNSPEEKFFKTFNESLIEFIPGFLQEAAKCAFVKDLITRMSHRIEISVKREESHEGAWSVNGLSFTFQDQKTAENEIQKWGSRLKVRRIASVLSNVEFVNYSIVAISSDGHLYVTDQKESSGQPGVFNSKICAAIALVELGEDTWKRALDDSIDFYDI